MGSWKLEVFRMAMYMSFPVLLFHYFNQPEYFEKFVIEKKRQMYPHEDEYHRKDLENVFRYINDRSEHESMVALEKAEAEKLARKAALTVAAAAAAAPTTKS